MEKSGFFNAEMLPNGEYDRVYMAEDFANYFANFISNGVFAKSSNNLQVLENYPQGMKIAISSGWAWIDGYYYCNTELIKLPISPADSLLNRIDTVVLRKIARTREIKVYVKQGIASAKPVAPSLQRDADAYELQLCEIAVSAGLSKITNAQIKDTRGITSLCGFVTGLIDQIDTTSLFKQFESRLTQFIEQNEVDFDTWFEDVKGQLSQDAAGNLQNSIISLKEKNKSVINTANNSTIIPVVLHKYLSIGTTRGPLIIELPIGFIGTIFTFDITIANNTDDDSVRYSFVGQLYPSEGGKWTNETRAYVNGISKTDKDNLTVRFGYIGEKEKAVIAIGDDNTSWHIPMITVRDFVAYFTKFDLNIWQKGWDCKIGKLGDYTWQIVRENPNQLKISQATIDKFKALGME